MRPVSLVVGKGHGDQPGRCFGPITFTATPAPEARVQRAGLTGFRHTDSARNHLSSSRAMSKSADSP